MPGGGIKKTLIPRSTVTPTMETNSMAKSACFAFGFNPAPRLICKGTRVLSPLLISKGLFATANFFMRFPCKRDGMGLLFGLEWDPSDPIYDRVRC